MLAALIRTNLAALFSHLFRGSKLKKNRGVLFKIFVGLLALYIIAVFLFMFGSTFYGICIPLGNTGLQWLYFGIAAIIATALCFIGSVFTAKMLLFNARDNDFLLSMPIPPAYILASRIFTLLVLNYFFELLVMVPAGFVYFAFFQATLTSVVFLIIGFLFLPLISLTLSCIFGWIIQLIEARVRNKSLITTIISLAFLAVYFYLYSKMNRYLQILIMNIVSIGETIKSTVFPVYHFGAAIADGNPVSLFLFLIFAVVPFAIVYMVLSYNFIKVATTNKGTVKIKYTDKPLKVSNVRTALLKKELRHFITNPMYILNAALGVFFTLTAAVALVIYGGLPLSVFESMPEFARFANPLAITALCFLATTNIISAPSISLEGRNLWIPQSLPIDGVDVLLAKANMHIVVCLPSVLIAGLVSIFVLDMTFPQMLLMLILPSLITVFCALFGVVINLHFPKFDWVNEVVAIKQGMSTIIAMLASMASVAVPFLLYAFLLLQYMTAEAFMLICTVIFAVLSLWMFRYLKTKGKAIFETLG
ncbi:MAG: hypothetical protein GX045_07180 [Clostridiaceae bacterium]|jgi:ABC-2 type transport system permease protein|nr:hypothetical protein [Clostridiaceae bacterium]